MTNLTSAEQAWQIEIEQHNKGNSAIERLARDYIEVLAERDRLRSELAEAWSEAKDAAETVGISAGPQTSLSALICGTGDRAYQLQCETENLRTELASCQEQLRQERALTKQVEAERNLIEQQLANCQRDLAAGAKEGRAAIEAYRVEKAASLADYLMRQDEWSARTFGQSLRTIGIVKHIRKELEEILKEPHDLTEWIDVAILALDGYWRHGGNPKDIMKFLQEKQDKNFSRQWPSPPPPEDEASEHIDAAMKEN